MTSKEVMSDLKKLGTDQIKKIWINHGAKGDFFGVKVGDMKVIQKKIKHDHALSLELFDTRNADAMYFAGLISEPQKMSKAELQHWAEISNWHMLSECTVSWAAAESKFGHELAMKWIKAKQENIASAGWSTYSCLLALKKDEELDLKEIETLLETVKKTIHSMPNRVRHTMNNFVIAVGTYVTPLTSKAKAIAKTIGVVSVNMGNTACNVPDALAYIKKAEDSGKLGKKKKTVFC
ncbi:MAG TPA: DNA alkylation repair protein [Puia sp.]|jgi:3-methyladenine DNA glycosylase AlkD|nr:DNA alkylation repair protein [Puia sp.]